MLLVTPTTVLNPFALESRHIPRRFLVGSWLIPVRGAELRLILRLIFVVEMLRYLTALVPFAFAAMIWPDKAIDIAQAPQLMFKVIYAVEMCFVRLPPDARKTLLALGEADRSIDLLRARCVSILIRVAANRGLKQNTLQLAVEQSGLFRIAPLTLLSVQSEDRPQVLRLDPSAETLIRDTLFSRR